MTTQEKIEILMKDRCTKKEAESFLQDGTTIFTDFKENFNSYMEDLGVKEEEILEYKKMIEEKEPVENWGIVEHEGNTYYIMYLV